MGMMINRRRVMGGKKGLLPIGYTQLEYIESTGTQYINTGINNWNNTLEYEIKLDIRQQTGTGYKTYYGCYDVFEPRGHVVPGIATYTYYRVPASFTAGYAYTSGTDIGIRNGQTGIISLKGNSISWSVGSSTQFNRGSTFTVNVPIILFGTYVGNVATEFTVNKKYYAKFWLDGVLVRDYIPCISPNNIVGMYDTVEGFFYSSPNGVAFVAGPVV